MSTNCQLLIFSCPLHKPEHAYRKLAKHNGQATPRCQQSNANATLAKNAKSAMKQEQVLDMSGNALSAAKHAITQIWSMSSVKNVNVDGLSQTSGCLAEELRVAANAKRPTWPMSSPKSAAVVKVESAKDIRGARPCVVANARRPA